MPFNWRPDYEVKIIHKEIDIIKNDLHCNAIKICGQNIKRVVEASEYALSKDLEVWFSAELWNKDRDTTLKYTVKAAKVAEQIYDQWQDKIIFSFGTELSFFINGILKGRNFSNRVKNSYDILHSTDRNKKLNNYFTNLNREVKKVFQGKTTYSSLIFENVDWNIFDFIGIDHYWNENIADKYINVIERLENFGKPIEITEFGFKTFSGAGKLGELGDENIDNIQKNYSGT